MLNNIKWLFFDVGSTLVDETDCYNHRIQDAIAGTNITFEEFNEKRMFFSKKNLKVDIEALRKRIQYRCYCKSGSGHTKTP